MPDWPVVLTVLIAVVVLGGLLALAAWWYLPPVDLPGPVNRTLPDGVRSNGAGRAGEFSSDDDPTELCQECLGPDGIHCDGSDRYCDCPCGWAPDWATGDEDWADQLHEINQLGKFGDLTRPVAHMTHYEVEALIRTLGVPEWVPDRYRMAA